VCIKKTNRYKIKDVAPNTVTAKKTNKENERMYIKEVLLLNTLLLEI
jgi:hypothetical protein